MKKWSEWILLTALTALTLTACDKRPDTLEAYLPQVEFTDAEVLLNGNVRVTGRVISEGESDLYYLGFAADSVEDFQINTNQVLVNELIGGEFSAEYGPGFRLDQYDQVYFQAFAVNEFGFATSAVHALEGGAPGPAAPDVPCTLSDFGFSNGIFPGWQSISAQSDPEPYALGGQTVLINGNSAQAVQLRYQSLQNGVYTTTSSAGVNTPYEMRIGIIINNQEWTASAMNEVYVHESSPGTFTVYVCPISWWHGFGQDSFSGKFSISVE